MNARARSARQLAALVLLAASALPAAPALGAENLFVPSLSVSEEFNDNIYETLDRRSDWITRVRPGLAWKYRAATLTSDLAYTFDYRNYARKVKEDETVHYLSYNGSAALSEKRLFLDLYDQLSRVSLSVARDVRAESLFVNQVDQNIAAATPYLLWHPGAKSTLKTGYTFSDTRYWGSNGISKRQHRAFADFLQPLSERLELSASYAFSTVNTDLIDYREHDVSVGLRYEYAERSFLFGSIGNSWQSFERLRQTSNLFYQAGVTHAMGTLSATVQSQTLYTEDPLTASTRQQSHLVRLEKAEERLGYGLSASYSTYRGALSSASDRTSLTFQGFWRSQLTERFSANFAATGDRVKGESSDGYPYHANATLGVGYRFNYDISAALTYGYLEYRKRLESATDARRGNRAVLELTKAF